MKGMERGKMKETHPGRAARASASANWLAIVNYASHVTAPRERALQ
jgi:hypothetical protein